MLFELHALAELVVVVPALIATCCIDNCTANYSSRIALAGYTAAAHVCRCIVVTDDYYCCSGYKWGLAVRRTAAAAARLVYNKVHMHHQHIIRWRALRTRVCTWGALGAGFQRRIAYASSPHHPLRQNVTQSLKPRLHDSLCSLGRA